MKFLLQRFTGGNISVELERGATVGATVGRNLYWADGTLVTEAQLTAGSTGTPTTPGTTITAWSLLLDIPPNIVALSSLSGTGIVVRTGDSTFALRDITSSDGSVAITNPGGIAGDIDLSVPVPDNAIYAPMVTGEIDADQPVFMYFGDGSLFMVQVA